MVTFHTKTLVFAVALFATCLPLSAEAYQFIYGSDGYRERYEEANTNRINELFEQVYSAGYLEGGVQGVDEAYETGYADGFDELYSSFTHSTLSDDTLINVDQFDRRHAGAPSVIRTKGKGGIVGKGVLTGKGPSLIEHRPLSIERRRLAERLRGLPIEPAFYDEPVYIIHDDIAVPPLYDTGLNSTAIVFMLAAGFAGLMLVRRKMYS